MIGRLYAAVRGARRDPDRGSIDSLQHEGKLPRNETSSHLKYMYRPDALGEGEEVGVHFLEEEHL